MSHGHHQHIFELISVNHSFHCKLCEQPGFGSCVRCKVCNLLYHEECEKPTDTKRYPFSTNCVLKRNHTDLLLSFCHVCGKKITALHYKCTCNVKIRHAHPECLTPPPTLVVHDGLTLNLSKRPTAKCLHCGSKHIRFGVISGLAYVSSNGEFCYHVACVKDIIHDKWKANTQNSDPGQIIKEHFFAQWHSQQKLARQKKIGGKKKRVMAFFMAIKNHYSGDMDGLTHNAARFMGLL